MTENYFEMIKGLSPQEQQNVLAQVKEALIEKSAEKHDKAETLKQELSQAKDEELADEVARFNPRTSDGNRYRKVRSELRRRLEAAATERNQATMAQSDYQELQTKRADLVSEMDLLGKNPSQYGGMKRIREIKAELKALPPEPDRIINTPEVKKND